MKTLIKTVAGRIFRTKVLSPLGMAAVMYPLAHQGNTIAMVAVAINLFALLVCILSPVK